ncbi:hypothetical protein CY34DRAFT_544912 [Suillus luteus UH-Slu-Lm8-n1]|uniref:Uncharacterized protein n=1 Tax=Suillus luteus UH-Slu-Lm8-n1 TaxID=930992 RepID=A0A0D0AW08_9AGAM|nr:hypothetical protein CY34DRAFT_544912 [Suillus luteus UH-Slu-Lm8-n1]
MERAVAVLHLCECIRSRVACLSLWLFALAGAFHRSGAWTDGTYPRLWKGTAEESVCCFGKLGSDL